MKFNNDEGFKFWDRAEKTTTHCLYVQTRNRLAAKDMKSSNDKLMGCKIFQKYPQICAIFIFLAETYMQAKFYYGLKNSNDKVEDRHFYIPITSILSFWLNCFQKSNNFCFFNLTYKCWKSLGWSSNKSMLSFVPLQNTP